MADKTIATTDYFVVSFTNRNRQMLATPATAKDGATDMVYERSFTPATQSRPARGLIKFSVGLPDADGKKKPCSLHCVLTVHPDVWTTANKDIFTDSTNGICKQLIEVLSQDTDFEFLDSIANGFL